ncbi:ATP-dependent helicase [Geminocystis sp. GBBB08]|uniref:ATP-dependent helicase n=1 Tax=Geminocystis sp. GBBB08 TaxID=2604140 RepID=UPI0027E360EF|nr:ATP-dependent helicase [Geminocystis sp. GBBB08]MBL1209233.1 ATP-dependent helicase [Geminocystis sp. GBBB08]
MQNLIDNLREGQKYLGEWKGGKMAISAVPGAGKSHSLAVAATVTIKNHNLNNNRQLLIVTYTRSATASIKDKIKNNLKQLNLPSIGFSVQTIHGLAVNIANRHPLLSQLHLESSTLIDATPSHRILRTTVTEWAKNNGAYYQLLLKSNNFDGEESERLRRDSALLTEVLPKFAHNVIRQIKSSGLTNYELDTLQDDLNNPYRLIAMAKGLYQEYEMLMKKESLIDYDDLILGALRVLEDDKAREMWQKEVFGVFEDEAQDSSPLQGKLLEILATDTNNGKVNFVRVGDPNQAINSTFTASDPLYFRLFCHECQENGQFFTMNQAGRSSKTIIETANKTLKWVNQNIRQKLPDKLTNDLESILPFREQYIEIVGKEDQQSDANPQAEGKGVEIYEPEDIYKTVELIGKRIIQLFNNEEAKDSYNLAILVRENRQGFFLAKHLEYLNSQYKILVKLIHDVNNYTEIPQQILSILQFIDCPHSREYLKNTLETLQNKDLIEAQDLNALSIYPEKFLYPSAIEPPQSEHIKKAKNYCLKLLKARLELPHYRLIPFISSLLGYKKSELATAQKLSETIYQQIIGNSSLKTMISTLQEIINSEKFKGVEIDNEDIYSKNGQVTIMTMHKAKGLQWDYVFLPFLHENVIPGGADPYVPKSGRFLGNFSLPDVARTILRSLTHQKYSCDNKPPLTNIFLASQKTHQLKQAEEYRLLYVAMTRAKRLLWMSSAKKAPWQWNFFEDNGNKNQLQDSKPCPVIDFLQKSQ